MKYYLQNTNILKMSNDEIPSELIKSLKDTKCDNRGALQNIMNKCQRFSDAERRQLINDLVPFIDSLKNTENANKIEVDLAFKCYYKLLTGKDDQDEVFLPRIKEMGAITQTYIVCAILFTEYHYRIDKIFLAEKCKQLFDLSISSNANHLLISLRALNLLLKKYEDIDLNFSLDRLYFCMQAHIYGVREETLKLFEQYTKNFNKASFAFNTLVSYWPWTNKYKFYLLSVLLSNHKLSVLFNNISCNFRGFFDGIRLSLIHKNLFSGGQSLIKALSAQKSKDLIKLVCTVFTNGTKKELSNLNSQWMSHFQQKQDVFDELGLAQNWKMNLSDPSCSYKFSVMCNIFKKQFCECGIIDTLLDCLIQICPVCDESTKLEVFKLVADSLTNSSIDTEKSLEFLIRFTEANMFVACPDFRHVVLGRYFLILNFLATIHEHESSRITVRKYFENLMQVLINGLSQKEYQPLFLSLKLLLCLLKCLFVESKKNISKKRNEEKFLKLGQYLISEKILSFETVHGKVLGVIEHSGEYDDVRGLIIEIMLLMSINCYEEWFEEYEKCNEDSDIDRTFLSSFFLKVALENCKKFNNKKRPAHCFKYCLNQVINNRINLKKDPLKACKNGKHLFGYINNLNELCANEFSRSSIENVPEKFAAIIECAESVLSMILGLLNVASKDSNSSACFQVMDQSLELLILRSEYLSEDHELDRKFLLLSFWMTLKACCDIATTLGTYFSKTRKEDDADIRLLEKCLKINETVLHKCRHKGAIEAAGISLGKLVKEITSRHSKSSAPYQLCYSCFTVLFGVVNKISTTRRGAGLSIMLHQMIKNDAHIGRPLFQHAIRILLKHTIETKYTDGLEDQQHENFDALVLHYLCVLVKDTELRENIYEFYDDIMMAAITKIEEKEWTIRNAALQLFGAIVPKILGQKQAVDSEDIFVWEPTEVTFTEIMFRLPKTCNYIFEYCDESGGGKTSSIILFLGFLSGVGYWKKDNEETAGAQIIDKFRKLLWSFLNHQCEKIRNLAAKCIARSLEICFDIPNFLFSVPDILFTIQNVNMLNGVISAIIWSINKWSFESKHLPVMEQEAFLQNFRKCFTASYKFYELCFYIRAQLIDLFCLVNFDFKDDLILEILCSKEGATIETLIDIAKSEKEYTNFGFEMWREKVFKIYKL